MKYKGRKPVEKDVMIDPKLVNPMQTQHEISSGCVDKIEVTKTVNSRRDLRKSSRRYEIAVHDGVMQDGSRGPHGAG